MSGEVRTRGDWPGVIQMRRGWAAARARPWNDQSPRTASLRLDRGGDRFVVACCDWLAVIGVGRVLTPALSENQLPLWRRAGFDDHLELTVFDRLLTRPASEPTAEVREVRRPDLQALATIDDRAFDCTWRVGMGGLADAMTATPSSGVLVVEEADGVVGFSIVGEAAGIAYLQRLAIDPDASGRGIGRSLVRASIQWARAKGARTMLLNTQPENRAAAGLYASEGFMPVSTRLRVLVRDEKAPTQS